MNGIKELLTYLTNQFKFWFIIKEWENGLQLRNGKIIRDLKYGIYFKIPFLDVIYAKPKRIQDIIISQINFTTKDNQQLTISAAAFFKINNIREYYNGYAEPLSIIDGFIKNEVNRYLLLTDYKDFSQDILEERLLIHLRKIKNKGFEFEDFKLTTLSNAKTYRLIMDKLYAQNKSELELEIY